MLVFTAPQIQKINNTDNRAKSNTVSIDCRKNMYNGNGVFFSGKLRKCIQLNNYFFQNHFVGLKIVFNKFIHLSSSTYKLR